MATSTIAPVTSQVTAAVTNNASSSSSSSSTTGIDSSTIAGNFQTFLTLLTTQLKNQNPLGPLDTNRVTQQLAQFAGVEEQLKTNDELSPLIAAPRAAQSTPAWGLVGRPAVVDGTTTGMVNSSAVWNLT